jgi:L-alanine-DL-glutamate epimerase-like enolase superfamily enzyme
LLVEPFDPTGGHTRDSTGPGLGVELDAEAVETYRIDA